ncbi:MAG: aminotransferase class I/II-fold pyridoxal phosphate-dependent enzyme [Oscillospiraceae bacterium]
MLSFLNDYSEGAHERILEALGKTNRLQTVGYGEDEFCARARSLITAHLGGVDAEVHFLCGGTQTNLTLIAAALRAHQGVVSADTGHVNVHEAGAIEATGHKVLAIPSTDGKISADDVKKLVDAHYADVSFEHTVQPGMVYISHPSELGTLYSKAQLSELSAYCRENGLPLFVDGARLGCALTAKGNDVTLADLAQLTDAFYIGGTKMGALFGEALVITAPQLKKDFRYFMKQRGGMLAKGRLLGIQFASLFEDDLYFDLARHANDMAEKLSQFLESAGCEFLVPTESNQLFPIMSNSAYKALSREFKMTFWQDMGDGQTAVRLVTSWATEQAAVAAFGRAASVVLKR